MELQCPICLNSIEISTSFFAQEHYCFRCNEQLVDTDSFVPTQDSDPYVTSLMQSIHYKGWTSNLRYIIFVALFSLFSILLFWMESSYLSSDWITPLQQSFDNYYLIKKLAVILFLSLCLVKLSFALLKIKMPFSFSRGEAFSSSGSSEGGSLLTPLSLLGSFFKPGSEKEDDFSIPVFPYSLEELRKTQLQDTLEGEFVQVVMFHTTSGGYSNLMLYNLVIYDKNGVLYEVVTSKSEPTLEKHGLEISKLLGASFERQYTV